MVALKGLASDLQDLTPLVWEIFDAKIIPITRMPSLSSKTCSLDPVPTSLIKDNMDPTLPVIRDVV